MVRIETNHPATPHLRLSYKQTASRRSRYLHHIRHQRRIVVIKCIHPVILRRHRPARPRIPRTQIASRIISNLLCRHRLRSLPLPRPSRPLRRNQHPLPPQRVIPPMRPSHRTQIQTHPHSLQAKPQSGAPSSTGSFSAGQGGVSFAEANDRLPYPTPNLNTVVEVIVSPGRKTVVGHSPLFGESG